MSSNNIKQGLNNDKIMEKREQASIKIGKDRRAIALSKRREMMMNEAEDTASVATPAPVVLPPPTMETFNRLSEEVRSGSVEQQINATRIFRKYLSQDVNPPTAYVISTGILPYFVKFLERDDSVVNAGAIDHFFRLLHSPSMKIQEQSIWGLANIAGDTADFRYRDYILSMGIMDYLLDVLNNSSSKPSLIATCAWCLSNLCRGKRDNRPDFSIIGRALPTLSQLLDYHDKDVIIDACWAFSFIADGTAEHIDAILELHVINRIVYLLNNPDYNVQTAALRVIVNIVAGTEQQTQTVLNANVLMYLDDLLDSPSPSIKKEALWTLSNITAGTPAQIEAVRQKGLFTKLYYLSNLNAIAGITSMIMNQTEPKLISMIIESLTRIFNLGEAQVMHKKWESNTFIDMFYDCGGCEKLEAIDSPDQFLYITIKKFYDQFFVLDDDDDNNIDLPDFTA
ncbi:hypothetical protein WA158_005270 [Blastocystis sp. Blastoise]